MEFFYCLLARPQASFHVEGGGPRAVEDRELGGSLEYLTFECPTLQCRANQPDLHGCAYVAVSYQSPGPGRLSPTAGAVPPLSEKEGFPSLPCPTNKLDPAAITHRCRGPPSFGERGLCVCATHIFLFIHLPYYAPTVPPLIYW